MKKLLFLTIIASIFLTGCSSDHSSSGHYVCEQKVIKIETMCKGVIGCNYIYYLENGSIISKRERPAIQDAQGNICILEKY